jgi:hypothetical protein
MIGFTTVSCIEQMRAQCQDEYAYLICRTKRVAMLHVGDDSRRHRACTMLRSCSCQPVPELQGPNRRNLHKPRFWPSPAGHSAAIEPNAGLFRSLSDPIHSGSISEVVRRVCCCRRSRANVGIYQISTTSGILSGAVSR